MTTAVTPDTYYGPSFASLLDQDPQIAELLVAELDRQRSGLQLIASENQTSPAVLAGRGRSPDAGIGAAMLDNRRKRRITTEKDARWLQ